MKEPKHIPVYSLDNFDREQKKGVLYQVEVFDANRHFEVQYPHKHDFYEILFLTSGSGVHIIDNNRYRIEPPCLFFLSPGQAHKLELSHDIGGFIFLFTSEFYLLDQKNKNRLLEFPFFFTLEQNNPPILLKNQQDIAFLSELFQRGCHEMGKANGLRSEEIIRSILDLILLNCDQLYPKKNTLVVTSKGNILVKNFLQLIEENYHKNLSVNQYADRLSITPNHLTQVVKGIMGKTSVQLLKEKTITEIKRMLQHSDLTITQIADLMHFPDQSYFSKYFRKETGLSPGEYRTKSMKYT